MNRQKLRALGQLFSVRQGQVNIASLAAAGAFYLFLSLVPLVLLFLTLLPYTSLTQADISQFLLTNTPEQLQALLARIVADVYIGNLAALSLSLLMMLWSAAKMMSSLTWGVNAIYQGKSRNGFLRQRLLGVAYTLGLILFIILSFFLTVFGSALVELFGIHLPAVSPVWRRLISGQSLAYLLFLTLFHGLLFTTVPRRRLAFYQQLPGAAFAAVMGLLFSRLYSWLVNRFDLYSAYGSLSLIIITLVWMYYSMYIIYLGAYLNTLVRANAPEPEET